MNSLVKKNIMRKIVFALLLVCLLSTPISVSATTTSANHSDYLNSSDVHNSFNDTRAAFSSNGLYKVDGVWRYYENGQFKKTTGLVQRPDTKTWHYVVDGVFSKSTGMVRVVQPGSDYGKWYYVLKGTLTRTTGLVKCIQPGSSHGKFYYVYNGKLNKDATGLVQCVQPGISFGKWYYVYNGRLNNDATGLVQCIQPGTSKGKYYYVKNSKLQYATGLTRCIQPGESKGMYYYVKNGKLNKYTGIVPSLYNDELYYVKNGSYNKVYSGISEYDNAKYYVRKGTIAKDELVQINSKWYGASDNGTLYKSGWNKIGDLTYYFSNYEIDSVFIQAKSVLDSIGHDLRKAYDWSAKIPYARIYGMTGREGSLYCARRAFTNRSGNCYCINGSFYIMAKMLGYDATQVAGKFNNYVAHSWVFINHNGTNYVYDPNAQSYVGQYSFKILISQATSWHYNSGYWEMPL